MKRKSFAYAYSKLAERIKALRSKSVRFKLCVLQGIIIGKETVIEQNVWIRPFAELKIGRSCYLGKGASFYVGNALQRCSGMVIGDGTWISQGCLLQCMGSVKIGANVLIGEYTSIRDTRHSYDQIDIPIKKQPDIIGEIDIEDNVWIGRGCLILGHPEGIKIGTGSIIGANSVVTKSIPPNTIWGGVPARFIKERI